MKKIIFCLTIALTITTQFASADVNPNRVLRCRKSTASLAIPSCGGVSCVATLKNGSSTKAYTVSRTRATDGSFIYKTKTGNTPSCTIALTKGNTGLKSVSCLPALKGASCLIS